MGGGIWEELATLIKDSFDDGLKKGLAEGIIEGKLELIKTLLKNGMSLDIISQYSGIPISELNSLSL